MQNKKHRKYSSFVVSLGCPKNRVDSERILGLLRKYNIEIANAPEQADLLIVNTCGFIEAAKEESIETILSLVELKAGSSKKLIVTGCLSQRYGIELSQEIPEVDFFFGTDSWCVLERTLSSLTQNLPEVLERVATERHKDPCWDQSFRIRSTLGGSAYLKISEGCNNSCSFCVIPSIRGPQRSRSIESLVSEAQYLVDDGVKELNLIAQDLTAYGQDLAPTTNLPALLEALCLIKGLDWIRMLYAYPRPFSESFLDIWSNNPKILPYLDIPLQHASASLLKRMKRPSNMEFIRRELNRIRQRNAAAKGSFSLRTTFLVGHPGETEEDFEILLNFIEEQRFERVGVFTYSDEEDSSSFLMSEKVDPHVAMTRFHRLMEKQKNISAEQQQKLLGQRITVLIDGPAEESDLVLQGRHAGQAPEIDGVVYIEGERPKIGEFVDVDIKAVHDYDLIGVCSSSQKPSFPNKR